MMSEDINNYLCFNTCSITLETLSGNDTTVMLLKTCLTSVEEENALEARWNIIALCYQLR